MCIFLICNLNFATLELEPISHFVIFWGDWKVSYLDCGVAHFLLWLWWLDRTRRLVRSSALVVQLLHLNLKWREVLATLPVGEPTVPIIANCVPTLLDVVIRKEGRGFNKKSHANANFVRKWYSIMQGNAAWKIWHKSRAHEARWARSTTIGGKG